MPRKKLSGPVAKERAAVVAYLRRVSHLDRDKANAIRDDVRTWGVELLHHYEGAAEGRRLAAYAIESGMHRRVAPSSSKEQP
jgi:hypothetical protein